MSAEKLLLRGGLAFSVLMSVPALVGGALVLFHLNVSTDGTPEHVRRAAARWAVSFAGTFGLSVMFFTLALRRGLLGR